jgi:hypothetical protein
VTAAAKIVSPCEHHNNFAWALSDCAIHPMAHAVSINRRYNSRGVCVTVNQVFVRLPIELETTPKCVDRGVRQPTWDFERLNPHGYGRQMRAPISMRVSTTVVVEQKQRNWKACVSLRYRGKLGT